jgi:hypothetical protein
MSERPLHEIEIVFDGAPGPVAGRFIEVQDPQTGESVGWGEWLNNGDGTWSLIGQGHFLVEVSDETP